LTLNGRAISLSGATAEIFHIEAAHTFIIKAAKLGNPAATRRNAPTLGALTNFSYCEHLSATTQVVKLASID
jgi:hypothetical protein